MVGLSDKDKRSTGNTVEEWLEADKNLPLTHILPAEAQHTQATWYARLFSCRLFHLSQTNQSRIPNNKL
jgi:hypothetical protein